VPEMQLLGSGNETAELVQVHRVRLSRREDYINFLYKPTPIEAALQPCRFPDSKKNMVFGRSRDGRRA